MSTLDIPVHLALTLLLATGAPLPDDVDRRVLAPPPAEARASRRADLGYSEERWLSAVQRHGRDAGLADLAGRVFRTSSGQVYTPVRADRSAILALLGDPAVTARVAGVAARADAVRLAALLGRPARSAELVAAHLLGIEAAETLLRLAVEAPGRPASEALPQAALVHPELFFRGVRPRNAAEILATIEAALARALPRIGVRSAGAR